MNYNKHYKLLCNRAKNRLLNSYTESHHIIPKCMGGSDDLENLVEVTPEDHYVAHQLLVKMYPKHKGLIWAAIMMTGHPNNKRSNNKVYGWIKKKCHRIAKARVGKKNGSYGRSWYHNPGTLENIKCLPEEVPEGYINGRKTKLNSPCVVCGNETKTVKSKYCDSNCRKIASDSRKIDIGDIGCLYERYKSGESLRQLSREISISHVALYERFKKLK